ncbi:hypothetical protein G7Y89_g1667 [Cudoniella acicularis]|uniref:Fatty acid desaturase domain-containing protein n=1 Tax=Cudoniella acicularis TaxID=354080 RepID=A0A8H4RUS9_9HELO|nr:hypothetical protein G7Y89_g1667 [Cudoniella acicularis]
MSSRTQVISDVQAKTEDLKSSNNAKDVVDLDDLRKAIPAHCWKPSYLISFSYLFRDLALAGSAMALAYTYIPQVENQWVRYALWALYGYVQGLFMTGIWVLGHECGHMAFSPSTLLNNTLGFILHSLLLTPYFSWQSSHRRHHIYANNLSKDHNYVPPQRSEYLASLIVEIKKVEELTEDSPIVIIIRILIQQIFGFPWYLATNITASEGSLHGPQSKAVLGNSHFLPTSTLFRPEEAHLILLSDLGLAATAFCLWYTGTLIGFSTMALLYIQPYMWVNHWIVAITYLHHTHPSLPKYEAEAWTFLRGATATIDRDFGWIGRHLMHNIIEYHVIHHLFSKIPFYYGEEATNAVIPLLGDDYHVDRTNPFLPGIWESFTKCQWVEPDDASKEAKDRIMWYKAGPVPPPETSMGIKKWL